jgi:hypothetical protein
MQPEAPSDLSQIVAAVNSRPGLSGASVDIHQVHRQDGGLDQELRISAQTDDKVFSDLDMLRILDIQIKQDVKTIYAAIDRIDYIAVTFTNSQRIGPIPVSNNRHMPPARP